MPYLAWIASELGSATGFPNVNIIPQKPQREEGQGLLAGRCVRHPPHSTPLLPPEGKPVRNPDRGVRIGTGKCQLLARDWLVAAGAFTGT
jgi:hypothetical protein